MRLGRVRPKAIGPHFRLKNYLRQTLPTPPASCDYTPKAMPSLSNVMGNDSLGDCVIAAGYHVVGVETGNADSLWVPSMTQVVLDYSAIGGYIAGQPETDQGCDEVTALNYWTAHGFANGTKLLGWLLVDAKNESELAAACFLFEHLFLTLELPDSYVNPFPSGNGWTWDSGTPDPNNGHAIMAAGYTDAGATIGTWGMLGTLTWNALGDLCTANAGGGVYVALTPDQLAKGANKAPNGFDWSALVADFDTMGGSVPVPAPPAPPPTPAPPGTAVTLADAQAWAAAGFPASGRWLFTRAQAEAIVKSALAGSWPSS